MSIQSGQKRSEFLGLQRRMHFLYLFLFEYAATLKEPDLATGWNLPSEFHPKKLDRGGQICPFGSNHQPFWHFFRSFYQIWRLPYPDSWLYLLRLILLARSQNFFSLQVGLSLHNLLSRPHLRQFLEKISTFQARFEKLAKSRSLN